MWWGQQTCNPRGSETKHFLCIKYAEKEKFKWIASAIIITHNDNDDNNNDDDNHDDDNDDNNDDDYNNNNDVNKIDNKAVNRNGTIFSKRSLPIHLQVWFWTAELLKEPSTCIKVGFQTSNIWLRMICIILATSNGYEREMSTFLNSAPLIRPRFLKVVFIGRHLKM